MDLQAEIARRRSEAARGLSGSQQAMGVTPTAGGPAGGGMPPSAPDQFGPQTGGGQPPQQGNALEALFAERRAKTQQLEARGQDLRLAQMLTRALDPALPKGFRALGLKQVAEAVGVSPKGERAKEMINTLGGLDPQSLESLRSNLVSTSAQAQPGEITKMTHGILSGQVPPDQFLQMTSGALQQPGAPEAAEADGGGLGGGEGVQAPPSPEVDYGGGGAPGQEDIPGASLPPPSMEPAPLPFGATPPSNVPQYKEATTPPRLREVLPEYAATLGLSTDERYRNIDLIRAGYDRGPSDAEGQKKIASDIKGVQDGVVNTMTLASQLAALVSGKPEALDLFNIQLPGGGGETVGFNPSSFAQQIKDFGRSVGVVAGFEPDWNKDADKIAMDSTDDGTWLGKEAKKTAQHVVKVMGESNLGKLAAAWGTDIHDTSVINARIQSLLVPLAFAMAAAKGQTGRFLSDRDVAFQLQEIGRSQSPSRFMAALTDMTERIYDQYDSKMRLTVGNSVPLAHHFSDKGREALRVGGIAPGELLRDVGEQVERRATGQPGASLTSPITTGSTSPAPGGDQFTPEQASEYGYSELPISNVPRQARPQQATDTRTPVDAKGRRKLERTGTTIEEEEDRGRRMAEEERGAVLEQRGRLRRSLEISESAEGRAGREEIRRATESAQQRSDRDRMRREDFEKAERWRREDRQEKHRSELANAFARLGAAISSGGRSSVSGPSGGSLGPEQDPAAFKIAPPRERRAPTPVPAGPFQPQPGRYKT